MTFFEIIALQCCETSPPLLGHACLCTERLGGYEADKEWAEKLLPANIPEECYMHIKDRHLGEQLAL